VPHIHLQQVLKDVEEWNKEKETEHLNKVAERERILKAAQEKAEKKK
jgi:hypothetical protein